MSETKMLQTKMSETLMYKTAQRPKTSFGSQDFGHFVLRTFCFSDILPLRRYKLDAVSIQNCIDYLPFVLPAEGK
jgi:hypothetical protein